MLRPVPSPRLAVDPRVPFHPANQAKVLSVFGTRPEIIKFAPVIQELNRRSGFEPVNVCTSQHTDLAAPFLAGFGIEVHHDLQVMRPGQPLNLLCSRILGAVDEILAKEEPDFVLVQGDTSSAMAGALAAFQRGIPVGHIEAGLRSGDLRSPFPEEMNRQVIGRMATVHFAATERNREALLGEGIEPSSIRVTGNPVIDALMQVKASVKPGADLARILEETEGTRRLVLTAHRRENFAERMPGYFEVLRRFLEAHDDTSLLFPVHPNPNVQRIAREHLEGVERVHLMSPLAYPDFLQLLSSAWMIVSDSGGIQEEAPSLRRPLLIIRENTERPEAVECGAARLIGEDPENLARELDEANAGAAWVERLATLRNPFGDGQSRIRIVDGIAEMLGVRADQQLEAA